MALIPFNNGAKPHILGQLIEVKYINIQAIAYCNCQVQADRKTILFLQLGLPCLCEQCRTQYLVQGVNQNGELNIAARKFTPEGSDEVRVQ